MEYFVVEIFLDKEIIFFFFWVIIYECIYRRLYIDFRVI